MAANLNAIGGPAALLGVITHFVECEPGTTVRVGLGKADDGTEYATVVIADKSYVFTPAGAVIAAHVIESIIADGTKDGVLHKGDLIGLGTIANGLLTYAVKIDPRLGDVVKQTTVN